MLINSDLKKLLDQEHLMECCVDIVDQLPIGVLIIQVNTEHPQKSILKYFNQHANKEIISDDLQQHLDKSMPELFSSKAPLRKKYVQVVSEQAPQKLVAEFKDHNTQPSTFSIVLLPLKENYVAAIYQKIDEKLKALKLSKEVHGLEEQLEDQSETIHQLMDELKTISTRIKRNGYPK